MDPKIPNILLVIFMLIATYSCRKKETPPDEEQVENPPVAVTPLSPPTWLVIDSTLSTVIKIPLKPITGSGSLPYPRLQPSGNSSFPMDYPIDLNGDGDNDINVMILIIKADAGMTLYDSWIKIKTLNNMTTILTDSIYYTYSESYLGDSLLTADSTKHNELYPKALNYKDTLKLEGRWRSGIFFITKYDSDWNGFTGQHYFHASMLWNYSFDNFVGIKCNGKLTWLRLNGHYDGFIEIRQAVISK
jgi:hypothetical protein